jgi:thioredoxin 1
MVPALQVDRTIFAEMHHEYAGKAVIGKLDVDDNPIVSTQFGVRNLPTLLYFKDGFVVDRQVGAVPKNVLTEKLDALFG